MKCNVYSSHLHRNVTPEHYGLPSPLQSHYACLEAQHWKGSGLKQQYTGTPVWGYIKKSYHGVPLSSVSARDPCAEALQRTQVRLPAWVPLLRVTPPLLPCFLSHSSAVLSIIKPEKAKNNRIIRKIYTRFRCEAVYRPALGPLHPNAVCPAYGHAHIWLYHYFGLAQPTTDKQIEELLEGLGLVVC